MIKIQCGGEAFLELDDLTEFQGELKKRTKKDIETVVGLITKYGFSFPFFVWKNNKKNNVLDGHGRILALRKMREGGETIPALPVCYVQAKDEAEAKKKLLHLNSQYGQMTVDSVMEFASGIELDGAEVSLPFGTLSVGDVADRAPKMETSFSYTEQFGVIVVCDSEAHQKKIYEMLTADGLSVRVVKV